MEYYWRRLQTKLLFTRNTDLLRNCLHACKARVFHNNTTLHYTVQRLASLVVANCYRINVQVLDGFRRSLLIFQIFSRCREILILDTNLQFVSLLNILPTQHKSNLFSLAIILSTQIPSFNTVTFCNLEKTHF